MGATSSSSIIDNLLRQQPSAADCSQQAASVRACADGARAVAQLVRSDCRLTNLPRLVLLPRYPYIHDASSPRGKARGRADSPFWRGRVSCGSTDFDNNSRRDGDALVLLLLLPLLLLLLSNIKSTVRPG